MTSLKTAVFTSDNSEDRLLESRIFDSLKLCRKGHRSSYIGFLNQAQIYKADLILKKSGEPYCFWGGYEDAERKILCIGVFSPDDVPVSTIEFRFRECDKLGHRDFLGSFMSLGIERDTIGDILIEDGYAVAFVRESVADYICGQVFKIGRVGVKPSLAKPDHLPKSEDTANKTLIVSSLRADAVISAFTGLSRERVKQLIKKELAFINYSPCKSISSSLKEGDVVSVRKYGKFIFEEVLGVTGKGRLKITVKYFS